MSPDRAIDERALPICTAAARVIARRFRGHVEYEDQLQVAYLWCLERPRKHVEMLDEGKDGEKKLFTSIRRHCEREARKIKAERLGTKISDEYFYDVGKLADIIPFIFNVEDWSAMPSSVENDRVSGGGGPAEGGNWLASVVDVKAGYDRLPIQYRRVLYRHFKSEWPFRKIAEAENCSVSQSRKLVARGVALLLDELGGASPW